LKGSIQQRGKQSWRIFVELDRDEYGKRKRKTETVTGTKADAQRRKRELLSSIDKGLPMDNSKVTVGEFLRLWLKDYAEVNTSAKTAEGYKGKIQLYLIPKLGHLRLCKLTTQQVNRLYADMIAKPLSPQTVLHTHRILKLALGHAVKWGIMSRNVCDAVDPPRVYRKEMVALDIPDIQRLLEAAESSTYKHVFFLALYTGLRRGELLGLRWSDVDLKDKTLSVNQNAIRLKGNGIILTKPKTERSRRLVRLWSDTVMLLNVLKTQQKDQLEMAGIDWDETSLVFQNSEGKTLSPDTVSHAFKKIVKQIGLPNLRFHDLRHTHATIMLKVGTPPNVVSERLGHSSVSITMDIYSHVLPGMQEEAAKAFENALKNCVSKPQSIPL